MSDTDIVRKRIKWSQVLWLCPECEASLKPLGSDIVVKSDDGLDAKAVADDPVVTCLGCETVYDVEYNPRVEV